MSTQKDLYRSYAGTHYAHTALMRDASYEQMSHFYRGNYLRHLPRDRSAPICELGCGAGHFLYFLRKEGYTNLVGVDLSEDLVKTCQDMGFANVEYGDALSFLQQRPAAFSAVVCNDLIEHIPRAQMIEFVSAAHGSLKEGAFIVKTINAGSLFGAREVFVDFTHEVGFTPESLTQVLRMGGFPSPEILPLRPIPQRIQGHLVKLLNVAAIEPLIKGFITVTEGPAARTPMVVTQTMLAVAPIIR